MGRWIAVVLLVAAAACSTSHHPALAPRPTTTSALAGTSTTVFIDTTTTTAAPTTTTTTAPKAETPQQAVAPPHAMPQTRPNGVYAQPWRMSVYYTAVESYHDGDMVGVTGCPSRDCSHGGDDLGQYPDDFVAAVKDEGTGRITSGPHAGKYLDWSSDTGYWLDTIPADSYGRSLVPFVSAATDQRVLPRDTRFAVAECGNQNGDPLDPAVCRRIQSAQWQVRDEFTPGLGGSQHVDLYIGEENKKGFTDSSPYWFDVTGARLRPA